MTCLEQNTGAIEDFQPRFPSGDTEWAEEINMNRQDQLASRSYSHSCCWIIELICLLGIDCWWWFGVFFLLRYILFHPKRGRGDLGMGRWSI